MTWPTSKPGKHKLYDLLNRCEDVLNRTEPTTAGYRMVQMAGLYIEDHNGFDLLIELGARFSGNVVHFEGCASASWDSPEVIEALRLIQIHTVLDDLADV